MSALVSRRFVVAVFLGAATPNSDATAQADSAQLENRIIDEIRLIGVNYTRPFVVTRELASREGKPYTAANARKDAERLDRLGIFSRIDVRGIEEQGRVVLEVDVLETTAFVPQISVRLTDEDGIQAGGGAATVNAMHRARTRARSSVDAGPGAWVSEAGPAPRAAQQAPRSPAARCGERVS